MESQAMSRSERLVLRKRSLAEALLSRTSLQEQDGAGTLLRELNTVGRERLLSQGAPVRQDEYWKYTDPSPLLGEEPRQGKPATEVPFSGIAGIRVSLREGSLHVDGDVPAGLEIVSLGRAASANGHWTNCKAPAVQLPRDPVPRPLAALNAAACPEGVAIRATAPVLNPVCLVHDSEPRGGVAFSRVAVRVESGASLEILEFDRSGSIRNSVIDARVEDGGRLDHVRIQTGTGRIESACAFIWLGEDAAYGGFTLSLDGILTRNETVLHLAGSGGRGHVAGGMLGAETSHLDTTVLVIHSATGCESRQVVRSVLDGNARGVFQGKVLVEQSAQQTDGYQISQAVLLDERAEFDSKPELEIYADDVKCSHGSTAGALDQDALFYLRSRGLGKREAESMLVTAFLEEALKEIRNSATAEAVRTISAEWMQRRLDGVAE